VDEIVEAGDRGPPRVSHPGWREAFPWLIQGTTLRAASDGAPEWDLGLFGAAPAGEVLDRWRELARVSGAHQMVHGRQVHGSVVRIHDGLRGGGLQIVAGVDGWVTRMTGALLTVATADCVPVFMVAPRRRAVALLHAGWRGVVEDILEHGIGTLTGRMGSPVGDLWLHMGPAICGSCYEVGPEVHEALGLEAPAGPAPVDLREVLAERAVAAGVGPERLTVSRRCTRCDPLLFSHRGGDRGRQISFLGRTA
jgi:hypothetical protein